MPKRKRKPDLYARAKGYGVLNALHASQLEPEWKPVAGFPQYEVTKDRQVRRTGTHAFCQPYKYMLRPEEGEFVDFWISGQKHTISLDAIMSAAYPKREAK